MGAIILNIGDEILSGDILNTNSQFISKALKNVNIEVSKIYVIKDDINSITSSVKHALTEDDIIIITGGLGPTEDDKTREGVSKALDMELIFDDKLFKGIKRKFDKNNHKMSKNNIKQAYKIKTSFVMENKHGTAPGMIINVNSKKVFILPGPPKELQAMFNQYVIDALKNVSDIKIFTRTIHTIGIGESLLEEKIKNHFNEKIQIGMYAKNGIVDVKVSSKSTSLSESKNNVNDFINILNIDEYVWGYDNDTLESICFELLKQKNLTIGFSESLTGGLISSNFTRLPGVSEVFPLSLVTYSNDSKIKLLDVKETTLSKHGAVSKETALEMANGLINNYDVDVSLSVTGIAGPTGATKNKPIGLVYIGISDDNTSIYKEIMLRGNRNDIQNKTSLYAFNELRKFLLKNHLK